MTRIIHLTDLHFGLHRAELVAPLAYALRRCQPDLLVVSGDLSHRARPAQFRQAMAFLRGLDLPLMLLPGNHDIPLFNPVLRLLDPFGRYRRDADADLTPMAQVGRLRLFGVNTVNPLRVRRGRLRTAEIERIARVLEEGPHDAINILVGHHPFKEPPGFQRGETKGAQGAMARLSALGLHVILTGHLHHWSVGLGLEKEPRALFQMQTGTALCGREGEMDHGFAVLDFAGEEMTVTPWIVDEAAKVFAARPSQVFARHAGLWQAAPERKAPVASTS